MSSKSASSNAGKLGLIGLIAIVVSSMMGAGVFSLPQNTAQMSAVGPVLIAWIVAGVGVYFLANTFRRLSDLRPDLQAGMYMYGQEGFGSFIGFLAGWGYWLMTAFGNVAFAVILMSSFNFFFPDVFGNGNNLTSIICGSVLIWGYNFLVLSGVKVAGVVNVIGTIAKLVPLLLFVVLLGFTINYSQIFDNFWGESPAVVTQINNATQPVSLAQQILAPMTVTLWAFIGVEGAVVLSGRAKNPRNVGAATLIGFLIALVIYAAISILPFGVMTQPELSNLANPSTAGVLNKDVGEWGSWLMNVGLIISVLVSWLAWTMLCAEIPMVAGQNGAFPKAFAHKNKHDSANVSLWVSSIIMQAALLLVYFSENAWVTMYNISTLMVVPAYLASALFMVKMYFNGEYSRYNHSNKGSKFAVFGAIVGAIFCVFILYASDIQYVVLVPFLLTIGIPFFIWARKEKQDNKPIFTHLEKVYVAIILILDAGAVLLYATGAVSI